MELITHGMHHSGEAQCLIIYESYSVSSSIMIKAGSQEVREDLGEPCPFGVRTQQGSREVTPTHLRAGLAPEPTFLAWDFLLKCKCIDESRWKSLEQRKLGIIFLEFCRKIAI